MSELKDREIRSRVEILYCLDLKPVRFEGRIVA